MIINRYVMRHVFVGTMLALTVLISIALFFTLIGELKFIGRGDYGVIRAAEYVALLVPGKIVEFMPLAILLGTILNLGSLASNSEIIAMQAAGLSAYNLLKSVLQSAIILALLTFIVADWVVPFSETSARDVKSSAINATTALRAKQGVWIKDLNQVLYIKVLLPDGVAKSIEIYQLDGQSRLVSTITAESAIPRGEEWVLQKVKQTLIGSRAGETAEFDEMNYKGNISFQLLDALMIEPEQMSSSDLYAYLTFLAENNLDNKLESLTFWQKVLAPLTVIIMCILAVPFVLGSQRQSNAGQRLMFGILLGLGYIVAERLLTLLGSQLGFAPALNAISPTLLFLFLAIFLLIKKQSHGISRKV
jgi:lipopolysaccharide export system permease protein